MWQDKRTQTPTGTHNPRSHMLSTYNVADWIESKACTNISSQIVCIPIQICSAVSITTCLHDMLQHDVIFGEG